MKKNKKEEKQWRYKTNFTSIANFQKKEFPGKQFSAASIDNLESLKSLGPSSQEIKDNPELLYTAFNVAVSNLVNLNGDAISNETALKIAKLFKNRPMDIEHYASDIVGVITNYGFSSFPDNQVLDENTLGADSDPFNICLAAIVWRYNNPYFAEHLKDTNEDDSWCYKGISTSWEIAFDEYVIARGSKNLSKAEIITDKDEVERLSQYLTCCGGNGFDETNTEVYRVITGDARPLGAGFVGNPAASVKGVLVIEDTEEDTPDMEDDSEMELEDTKEDESKKKSSCNEMSSANTENNLNKNSQQQTIISQKQKITVNNIKSMKFTNVDELYDHLAEASAKGETYSPKDIRDLVNSQIKAANEKFEADLTSKAKELSDLQSLLDSAKASIAELEKVRVELDETKASIKEQEEKNVYNTRISDLDDKYNLNDKTRKMIANHILGKSDAEYKDWLESEGDVILAGKEKQKEEPKTPEDALKTSTASVNDQVPNASVNTNSSTPVSKTPTVAQKGSSLVISL